MDGAEQIWRAALLLPIVSTTVVRLSGFGLWEIGIPAGPDAAALSPLTSTAVTAWTGSDVARVAALGCLAIGALLVMRDRVAHRRFVRALGARRPAGEAITRQVADLLILPGVRRPIRLTCAPAATSPMVLGRGEICLPARVQYDLSHGQLRALVAHEVAHVIRADSQWFAALAWLESALFIQPLNPDYSPVWKRGA